MSAFRRGILLGVAATVVVGVLAAYAVVTVWAGSSDDDPPEPTASRHEVSGEVVSRSAQTVCVEVGPTDDDGPAGQVCGSDVQGAVDRSVAVGDVVVGELVDVELDPGSGAHWSLWSYLTSVPE